MRVFWNIFGIILHLMSETPARADLTDLVSEATCAARCFKIFTQALTGPDRTFLEKRPDLTQPHCINQKESCASCLEICQWPRTKTLNCEESCESLHSSEGFAEKVLASDLTCISTCQFANDLYTSAEMFQSNPTISFCPLTESWPKACTPRCIHDGDCKRLGKCCSFLACSRSPNETLVQTCSPGVPTTKGVPEIPSKPKVKQLPLDPINYQTEHGGSYQLELDWLNYYNQSGNRTNHPIVFLVQLRQFYDPDYDVDLSNNSQYSTDYSSIGNMDHLFDNWRSLVWTTKLGAVLSDLRPATWYQFRLIAISEQGHGGWSEPSGPVRVLTRPIPPSSPRNLTEIRSRIFDDHIDVTVQWEKPELGNLPLRRYQISWRKYFGANGQDRSSLTEYEANVPGDKHIYTIQGLPPGTTYKVEVIAISTFETQELKSHPANLYFTTSKLPPRQLSRNIFSHEISNHTCPCTEITDPVLRVSEPYWDNLELKITLSVNVKAVDKEQVYQIEWFPKVCIETMTQNNHGTYNAQTYVLTGQHLANVELTKLSLQCHYKVLMTQQLGNNDGIVRPQSWSTCFCTRSCHQTRVQHGPRPQNCTEIGRYEALRPVKLSYELYASTDPVIESKLLDLADSNATDGERSYVRTRKRRDSDFSTERFHAVVSWENDDQEPPDRIKSFTQTARGIRITWGPRLYEPVELEAYKNGLHPLIDPEKTQSKVLESHMSSLFLRELYPETLYIVTVQLIGEHADGPTSTIFFAIPTTKARSSTNGRRRVDRVLFNLIAISCWSRLH